MKPDTFSSCSCEFVHESVALGAIVVTALTSIDGLRSVMNDEELVYSTILEMLRADEDDGKLDRG